MIDPTELQRRQELFNQGYWDIPDDLDTTNFDFNWRPEPWDRPYIHEFGTQWQKTGGPRFVIPENEGTKYQSHQHCIRLPRPESRNFRKLQPNVQFDYSWHPDRNDPPYIYIFGNQWYDSETMPTIQYRVTGATEKKYITDVRATLDPCMDRWIVPDYITEFDYSWVPNPNDPPYEHQFGTEWHYTAGPRYLVPGAKTIKYQSILTAKTSATSIKDMIDVVEYKDSVIETLRRHSFKRPFVYIKKPNSTVNIDGLLETSDSLLHVIDGQEIIASEKVMDYIFDKVYDYDKVQYHYFNNNSELLDIIFFSNGESCADANYQKLLDMKLPNRIVRVDGVQGRVASQHAAANASNTEWYFLINAKLSVNPKFDFRWQPDVLKSRRHYIFRATNPVNGLEYGHMAIVANNKTLTLNTKGRGLDFTLDSPTEVVDINCGIAVYNSSEWDTWRTAFRECIKLCYARDSESKKRLDIWQSDGSGEFRDVSKYGAEDAIRYFESVNGEFDKLKLSYDWAWLREFYREKYDK